MNISFGQKNKKQGGNKLNMIIAKTHRLSSRLVGMQLTSGNLFGVVLSMGQMSAGFVILTGGLTHGQWYLVSPIIMIGCALAILIERLSIGGLATVRESSEAKTKCENVFYALCEHAEPSPWAVENKERMVKQYKRDIKIGWAFGGGGMFLSTLIGDIFWHWMFSSLGNPFAVFGLSLACACVIGLTFVHSELFKSLLDRVLKAILMDMHLMKVAVAVETDNMKLDMKTSAMDDVRNDETVRGPIEAKLGRVVIRQLSSDLDSGVDALAVEGSLSPVPQIAAPAKGKYVQHRDELRRLVGSEPDITRAKLAAHFGISKSTAQAWLEKYKAGV